MNYLVGASGALRKGIYKFLKDKKAPGETYEDKIKWMKENHPLVAEEFFDALGNIQGMTSDELHEDKDWEAWKSEEFDFLVATIKGVLHEVYVIPEERPSCVQMPRKHNY